jgi:hypothetical protein
VEGAGPGQRVAHDRGVVLAQHFSGDALDAAGHLGGGAARKRQQQDAVRIGAVDDQMRDAMRKRVGLAGSSSGNDQQRRRWTRSDCTMFDGASLLRIEAFEIASSA